MKRWRRCVHWRIERRLFDGECRPMVAKPNPIDVHVGKRLRLRRTLLGMSQERLGELLGLTFQQVQKYERGVNRIGSSRLTSSAKSLMYRFFLF